MLKIETDFLYSVSKVIGLENNVIHTVNVILYEVYL